MTKELRYCFDLEDIAGIAFICRKYEMEIVYRLESQYRPTERCVSCDARLGMPVLKDGDNVNYDLLSNIRRVLKLENSAVKLRFIVKEEKS